VGPPRAPHERPRRGGSRGRLRTTPSVIGDPAALGIGRERRCARNFQRFRGAGSFGTASNHSRRKRFMPRATRTKCAQGGSRSPLTIGGGIGQRSNVIRCRGSANIAILILAERGIEAGGELRWPNGPTTAPADPDARRMKRIAAADDTGAFPRLEVFSVNRRRG